MPQGGWQVILFYIFLFAFVYYILIVPQRRADKKMRELQSALKVGDRIVTLGGIQGKVINLTENNATIEASAENTKIDIARWAVREVVKE